MPGIEYQHGRENKHRGACEGHWFIFYLKLDTLEAVKLAREVIVRFTTKQTS